MRPCHSPIAGKPENRLRHVNPQPMVYYSLFPFGSSASKLCNEGNRFTACLFALGNRCPWVSTDPIERTMQARTAPPKEARSRGRNICACAHVLRVPSRRPGPCQGSDLPSPDFACDFAYRSQNPPYLTLLHPTLCIGDLSDNSSSYRYLRRRRFGLKIPRPQGHGGSTPPSAPFRINDLQRPNFLHTPKKGMTLPVTLPIALQTTLDVQPF